VQTGQDRDSDQVIRVESLGRVMEGPAPLTAGLGQPLPGRALLRALPGMPASWPSGWSRTRPRRHPALAATCWRRSSILASVHAVSPGIFSSLITSVEATCGRLVVWSSRLRAGRASSGDLPIELNIARHGDRTDMPSVAVITGASSGIGLATTRALAAADWSVIATARQPETAESLREIADEVPGVELRTLDVTSDESVGSCIDSILADLGGIDLLVNNAGAGHRGTLEQLTMDELSQAMELNFFGVARVTKAVLPAMRAARTGRVITVTSLNGVVALPFSDAYNAAKFAVEGLMESLATVMREFDVYISVLEPGPVRTAFYANLGGHVDNVSGDDPYVELINRYNARMAALGSSGQSAESVADVIREIAADPSPALRYQSSEQSRAIAAQKLVDTTGRSILAGTRTMLHP
jgi:NAD(P)-dependent dehydrogenase (short-subunit alcohol dehydrogenase family)